MSRTGEQLLSDFSIFLDDSWASATDGAGTTTTLVDSVLQRFRENANEESFIRFTEDSTVAGNIYLVRRVTNFTGSTLTFAPAVPQAVETAKDYQLHRWDPVKKFRALDRARILAFPQVAKIIVDETVTSDGESTELSIPSSIRRGPATVWYEDDLDTAVRWNILANPKLTSASGWTATSVNAATYSDSLPAMTIPRLETSCVKLTSGVAGSLSQALGGTYAAFMAGRKVSFGVWIYSLSATCTVSITDDSATSTSVVHSGLGWQFLQVTRSIVGTNASTLTFKINPLTNNAVFVERAYAGAINRIQIPYSNLVPRKGVHRDDDDAMLRLMYSAPKGRQYRLEGRTPVTALDFTSGATLAASTMEVGVEDQDLLIATAARILLTWEGMSAGEIEKVYPQIAVAEQRFKELQEDWKRRYPRQGFIQPAW